jgi:hypothetical protein
MVPADSYVMINEKERFLEVKLSVRTFKDNGWYIAECPELDLADQGKTKRKSIENLHRMVIFSLIEAIETGHIEPMLKKLGFNKIEVPVPDLMIFNIASEKYEKYDPLYIGTPYPLQKPADLAASSA